MNKPVKIISFGAMLISIFFITLFKSIPSGRLWDQYVVMYVPSESDDNIILNGFQNAHINDVVALSQQFLPLNISEDSLEYAMYKINSNNEENQYINSRNDYFFDKTKNYRLYYIPRVFEHNIHYVISYLEDNNIVCGLDTQGSYPVLFPIIILLFTIAIGIISKNKFLFGFTSFIPVIFVFANPFFPIALSISLLILCNFFISNIWKRKGALSYLKTYLFLPLCLFIALLCSFSASIKSGFMFLITVLGVGGSFISFYWIEDLMINKKSFIPVKIRSAKMVSLCGEKEKSVFIMSGVVGIILLLVFFFTSSGVSTGKSEKLMLPSDSTVPSTVLPQLEDYYTWAWNVETFPYRSLNNLENSDKMSLSFPKYVTENGIIKETVSVFNFDEKFRDNIFTNISNLNFNSIESVLQSQGENFKGGYNSTSSYHIDLFGIIMIIMCYFILLFIYISIIITRKGTKK